MTPSRPALRPLLLLSSLTALVAVACGGNVAVSSSTTGSTTSTGGSGTTSATGAGGGATVCDVAGSPGACAACCEQQNPAAKQHFDPAIGDCVCSTCSPACLQSVCVDLKTPSDACLPCVQQALGSDLCQVHAGLFESACLSQPECAAYVQCLLSCPG